ncbi:MAG: tetratricopeptide repeat protein, partial [Elusimicrobiota bacterium]|nr:tetratricopeptide repeat protein [Elusimicrobiota bacterium]
DAIYKLKKLDDEDSQYYLGKSYEKKGQYVLAIGEYKSLLLKNPDTKYAKDLLLLIGESYLKSKNYNESIKAFLDYKLRYFDDEYSAFINYKIGCNYYFMQNYEKAIEFFDKVDINQNIELVNINKEELKTIVLYSLYLKAYCYYTLNRYEEAAIIFLNCYSEFSDTDFGIKSVFMSALCLYKIKYYENAENIVLDFQKNIKQKTIMHVYIDYLLSNIQYERKDFENAIKNYQKTLDKIMGLNIKSLYKLRDRALLMMLKIFYLEGNYGKIVTEFQYILNEVIPKTEKNPTIVEIYFIIADSCLRLKYFREAKKFYQQIADEYINDDIIYGKAVDGLAWCEFGQNNYVLAEKYRKIIITLIASTKEDMDTLKSINYYELANIYFNMKNYVGAIENYENFLNINKDPLKVPEALYRLGNAYYREEYYSLAIEKWSEILYNYPEYENILNVAYKIADTYYKSGKYMDAIEIYEYIFDNFDHSYAEVIESKMRIAQSYYNDKQYDIAILKFRDFILEYPTHEKAKEVIEQIENTIYRKKEYEAYQNGLTVAEINISKDFEEIFTDFVESNKNLKITTEIIYKIALNNYQERRYEAAINWYNKFFSLGNYSDFDKEKIAIAQYNLAEIFYILEQYKNAAKNYELLISGFKDYKNLDRAYIRLGTSYLNLKDYNKAIKTYEYLLVVNSNTEYISLAKYNLAVAYKEIGDFSKSNETFIDYYNLNSNDENAIQVMIEVGDTYTKFREYVKAVNIYKMILPKLTNNYSQKLYVQFKIAESYEKDFKIKEAIQEYKKLLDMEPKGDTTRLSGIIKLSELYVSQNLYNEAFEAVKEVYESTDNEQWKLVMESKMKEYSTLNDRRQKAEQ